MAAGDVVGLAEGRLSLGVGGEAVLQALVATANSGLIALAIFAVVLSLIGAFYYLRIVFYMYFGSETEGAQSRMAPVQWVMLIAVAAAMLLGVINLFGIEPAALAAAQSLVG